MSENKNTLVVNLFAGAGTGKSTLYFKWRVVK